MNMTYYVYNFKPIYKFPLYLIFIKKLLYGIVIFQFMRVHSSELMKNEGYICIK